MPDQPILIVGGGLGGLTAALALAQRGRAVRVFEGAPEFGAIGYGIQFGPNVFHVFDRLGLMEQVMAVGDEPAAVTMRDGLSDEELVRIPTDAGFRARFNYPYLIIHRIDLHNVMIDACRADDHIELIADTRITGYANRGACAEITTEDGETHEGEMVIGADGIGSTLRARMLGDGGPLPNGYVAHRTIIPMEELQADVPADVVVLWGGPGFHIVTYPLRHGALFNIVAVFRSANEAPRGDVEAYRAELQQTYSGAHQCLRDLIRVMDLERRFVVGDRHPVRKWHDGRVCLLGDAAHPTLQTLAQGACMAIEDGLHLAGLIGRGGGHEEVFAAFAADRVVRTARVTLESRAIWENYHGDGVEREVAFQQFRERSVEDSYRCLAWLYDGFAFAD